MKVTETHARKGKFPLFKTSDETISVAIRSINDQDAWVDGAADIADLESKIDSASNSKENRQAKREWEKAIFDAVFSYDEELSARRKELELILTKTDLINAFEELVNELDPFVARQRKKQEEGMALLNSLPKNLQEKAFEAIESGALEL